ncbi:MAG TPA: hypothetical protein VGQ35_03590, partial [Dongiaceae bacterium]|nr:hypothetical protein [Dongiaceae bacterium]
PDPVIAKPCSADHSAPQISTITKSKIQRSAQKLRNIPKPAARESLLVKFKISNSRAREIFRHDQPALAPTEAGLYVTVLKPVNVLLEPS